MRLLHMLKFNYKMQSAYLGYFDKSSSSVETKGTK